MKKCKKGGKYCKGLFDEELTFDNRGSAQSIKEYGDNKPMLIVNRTFFTPNAQDK